MKPFNRFFPRANLLICLIFFILFLFFLFYNEVNYPIVFFTGLLTTYCFVSGLVFNKIHSEQEKKEGYLHKPEPPEELFQVKNRNEFLSSLEERIKTTRKNREKLGLALIKVGLINNSLTTEGKLEVRTEINKEITSFIISRIQNDEIIARFDNEKFALLISEASKKDALKKISELHNELTEVEFEIQEEKTKIESSIGLATFPEDGETLDQLVSSAEKNLDEATKKGNIVHCSFEKTPEFNITSNTSFHSNSYFLDKIAKKSTQLFLLFQEKEIEIIKQEIDANKRFVIEKAEGWKGFEFFYILQGEVLHIEQNRVLSPGYFIKTGSSDKRIHFKTLTDVTFLYITNLPVFIKQTNEIKKMAEMISRVEQKDLTTESHGFRLQEMAVQIVEAMEELEDDKLFSLIYAAYLHDIGKLKVPTDILRKKGPLTSDEWDIIKKHPTWGSEIIKEKLQNSNSEDIAEIVHQHHENYDGTGYPRGLKGDQIRIEAQILSLLDTFDSMTSERPYQKAKTKEAAIEEIKKGSGTRFNPKIVKHFLRIIEKQDQQK